jgi:hypothetical protein
MTPEARARRPGVPALWALPVGILLGMAVSALAGVATPSVFLDMVAWWPVWFLLVVVTYYARQRYMGRLRLSGLVPLLGTAAAVVFLIAHLQGWPLMPSASGRLVGPEASFTRAELALDVEGLVRVRGDAIFLYEVFPIRWGNQVGLPSAVERTIEEAIAVDLAPVSDPGMQRFRGWEVSLSPAPPWELTLDGTVDADLSDLTLIRLALSGRGVVRLGSPLRAVEASIDGEYKVSVPPGVAARVIGEAQVPAGWERLPDGWVTPGGGIGWVLVVAPGSSLTVGVEG